MSGPQVAKNSTLMPRTRRARRRCTLRRITEGIVLHRCCSSSRPTCRFATAPGSGGGRCTTRPTADTTPCASCSWKPRPPQAKALMARGRRSTSHRVTKDIRPLCRLRELCPARPGGTPPPQRGTVRGRWSRGRGAGGRANPNSRRPGGLTALHSPAKAGQQVCRCLLDAKAMLTLGDYKECTVLHHAASGGHEAVAKLLLEAGGSPTQDDVNGQLPYDMPWTTNSSSSVASCKLQRTGRGLAGTSLRKPLCMPRAVASNT